MVNGEGLERAALSAVPVAQHRVRDGVVALVVLSGIGLAGCGESSRAPAAGSGAASGMSGTAGSGGATGGAIAGEGGGSGLGGAQSGAPSDGGTTGDAGSDGGSGGAAAGVSGGAAAGVSGGGTGAGGIGGDAGGMGGDAGDGGAPSSMLEPVRVIRGDPEQSSWWDLTLQGVELAGYEGKIVTARIGDPERAPERLGSGQARVEGAEFSLFFPQVWEESLYKYKRVYLDVNENGSCDAGADLVFHDARATPDFVLTLRAPAESPERTDLRQSSDPEADCAVFNATWPTE